MEVAGGEAAILFSLPVCPCYKNASCAAAERNQQGKCNSAVVCGGDAVKFR